MRFTILIAAVAWAGSVPAAANDTMAGFGVGGLELRTTEAVAMVSEVLVIRPNRITVRYVFRNETDTELRAIVAFPLPALDDVGASDVELPVHDTDNYVGFETRINGQQVPLQATHVASVNGVDRTADLARFGIPMVPFGERITDVLRALPISQKQYLRALGLLDEHGTANWTLQTTFWREQVFPPRQNVTVEHTYSPVAGFATWSWFPGSVESDQDTSEASANRYLLDLRKEFCPSDEILARGRAQEAGQTGLASDSNTFLSTEVDYILRTGANWRGPIGYFRLVVEAEDAWDFVLMCLPGAHWVSQSRVEFEARNFRPESDLSVHFARTVGEGVTNARQSGQLPPPFNDVGPKAP